MEVDIITRAFSALNGHPYESLLLAVERDKDLLACERLLACADILYLAGVRTLAKELYRDWLSGCSADGAFLPFSRTRSCAPLEMTPVLEAAVFADEQDADLEELLSFAKLFTLGRWHDAVLLYQANEASAPHWQVTAGYGLALLAMRNYPEAIAVLSDIVIAGHGLGKPYDGRNASIAVGAAKSADYARRCAKIRRVTEARLHLPPSPALTGQWKALETIDIFIKTCAKDHDFLIRTLRSIDILAKGFRQIVIVTDQGHSLSLDGFSHPHQIHHVDPFQSEIIFFQTAGYLHQQVIKLSWTEYSDADAVLILDSDTILNRLLTPSALLRDDRPIWYFGEWGYGEIWRTGVELAVGCSLPVSHMREHPFILTRHATLGLKAHIQQLHGCSFHDLYFGDVIPSPISEFEIFGAYLSNIARHNYQVIPHQSMALFVSQYWSWGGLSQELKATIDEKLDTLESSAKADSITD